MMNGSDTDSMASIDYMATPVKLDIEDEKVKKESDVSKVKVGSM